MKKKTHTTTFPATTPWTDLCRERERGETRLPASERRVRRRLRRVHGRPRVELHASHARHGHRRHNVERRIDVIGLDSGIHVRRTRSKPGLAQSLYYSPKLEEEWAGNKHKNHTCTHTKDTLKTSQTAWRSATRAFSSAASAAASVVLGRPMTAADGFSSSHVRSSSCQNAAGFDCSGSSSARRFIRREN
jgi:hypothetical protein